jgi:hypothetical protein
VSRNEAVYQAYLFRSLDYSFEIILIHDSVWLCIEHYQDRRFGAISATIKPVVAAAAGSSFGQSVNGIHDIKDDFTVFPDRCRRDSGTVTPNIHHCLAKGG